MSSLKFAKCTKLQYLFLGLCISTIIMTANLQLSIFNFDIGKSLRRYTDTFWNYYWLLTVGVEEQTLDEIIFSSEDARCDSENYFNLTKTDNCSSIVKPNDLNVIYNNSLNDTLDFQRVILIVSFNKPHFEAIPKIHQLYYGLFLRIIYCVTGIANLAEFRDGAYLPLINISIVEFEEKPTDPTGESFYTCVPIVLDRLPDVEAMVLNNETDGFLHISDDLILNLWSYKKNVASLDCNWHLGPHQALYDLDQGTACRGHNRNNTADCDIPEPWPVLWQNKKQLNETYNEAEIRYPRFISNLSDCSAGYRRVWNVYADMFYITRDHIFKVSEMFRFFAKRHIYMELAVGTILKGITDPWQLQILYRGGQVASNVRHFPVTETYRAVDMIYHPLKLGTVHNATFDRQCLYCSILDGLNRLREFRPKNKRRIGGAFG